jgi:hypothetical protein
MTDAPVLVSVTARLRRTVTDEHGVSVTVSVIFMAPVTVILLFAGIQTVLWQHARTIAADRANQVVVQVATGDLTPDEADTLLTDTLSASPDLAGVDVEVIDNGQVAAVTVTAQARGVLIGTYKTISITTNTPLEQWQALP